MTETRSLGLLCVKGDLLSTILEKTAVKVDKIEKLNFSRFAMAKGAKKQENNEEQAEDEQQHQPKTIIDTADTMFIRAYDQVQDLGEKGLANFRPPKPNNEVHIAFEIVFRGERVEGFGGPYRQFFTDISKELQPAVMERTMHKDRLL